MHRLPPLTVAAPIDSLWRVATLMLGGCVGAALGWWVSAWLELTLVVSVLLALATMLAAAFAARWHLRAPAGVLTCDGQGWTWSEGQASNAVPKTVTADVMIDAQSWLLLRLTPVHAHVPIQVPIHVDEAVGTGSASTASSTLAPTPISGIWLPLAKATTPQGWHVLRAALHAQQPAPSVAALH
jgi:hypothetical protein